MSTVNKTQATNQYDSSSMGTFQGFQPTIRGNLEQFANDPLKSSFFNQQYGMATQQNQGAFNTANNTFLQNQRAGGFVGNMPAFAQSQMAARGRGLSAANSNSFNSLLMGANQLRFGATQQMAGYRPLQTGQTQTQTQSGLGSWLPQLVGAGLGAAGMAMGMPPGAGAKPPSMPSQGGNILQNVGTAGMDPSVWGFQPQMPQGYGNN